MNLYEYLRSKNFRGWKERGNKIFICCPFHDDHNPSLNIDLDKRLWYCFGCAEGGRIESFIARLEGISYKNACQLLDDRSLKKRNMVNRIDIKKGLSKELMYQIYVEAEHDYLPSFLEQRGIIKEDLQRFRFGIVLDDIIVDLGTTKFSLMGWAVFPIFDWNDIFQGLSARFLSFKNKIFWNADTIAPYFWGEWLVSKMEPVTKVILVEGIFDAIFLLKNDLPTIAIMGKFLNDLKMKRLIDRGIEKVLIYLDPDAIEDATRLRQRLDLLGLKSQIIEANSDPDELSLSEIQEIKQVFENF